MPWYVYVSYVFGGIFMANAVPHWVAGVMGRPFQSPFAKPPGEGLSTSAVNVLWGGFNLIAGYLLLFRVGDFDIRNTAHILPAAAPAFLFTYAMSKRFGRFNGGNNPV